MHLDFLNNQKTLKNLFGFGQAGRSVAFVILRTVTLTMTIVTLFSQLLSAETPLDANLRQTVQRSVKPKPQTSCKDQTDLEPQRIKFCSLLTTAVSRAANPVKTPDPTSLLCESFWQSDDMPLKSMANCSLSDYVDGKGFPLFASTQNFKSDSELRNYLADRKDAIAGVCCFKDFDQCRDFIRKVPVVSEDQVKFPSYLAGAFVDGKILSGKLRLPKGRVINRSAFDRELWRSCNDFKALNKYDAEKDFVAIRKKRGTPEYNCSVESLNDVKTYYSESLDTIDGLYLDDDMLSCLNTAVRKHLDETKANPACGSPCAGELFDSSLLALQELRANFIYPSHSNNDLLLNLVCNAGRAENKLLGSEIVECLVRNDRSFVSFLRKKFRCSL